MTVLLAELRRCVAPSSWRGWGAPSQGPQDSARSSVVSGLSCAPNVSERRSATCCQSTRARRGWQEIRPDRAFGGVCVPQDCNSASRCRKEQDDLKARGTVYFVTSGNDRGLWQFL